MSVRTTLAAHFRDSLPPIWQVIGYPSDVDGVSRPTLMLWQSEVRKLPAAPSQYEVTVELRVVTPVESPHKADDALDLLLEQVLDVLEQHPAVLWDSAERIALFDRFPAYKITVKAVGKNEATP